MDIIRRQLRKRGHAGLGAAVLNHGADLFFFLIMQNDNGADQIRTLRAARIFSVTGGAILFEEGLAFFGGGGIGRGAEAEKFARGLASACASGRFLRREESNRGCRAD